MSVFVIADSKCQDLVTSVYRTDDGDAAMLFTSNETAASYLEHSASGESAKEGLTVAELDAIPLLQWLLEAYEDGVAHLVVDPDYAAVDRGASVPSLNLAAQLEQASAHILQLARPDF